MFQICISWRTQEISRVPRILFFPLLLFIRRWSCFPCPRLTFWGEQFTKLSQLKSAALFFFRSSLPGRTHPWLTLKTGGSHTFGFQSWKSQIFVVLHFPNIFKNRSRVMANVMIYWLTNSITSSVRFLSPSNDTHVTSLVIPFDFDITINFQAMNCFWSLFVGFIKRMHRRYLVLIRYATSCCGW